MDQPQNRMVKASERIPRHLKNLQGSLQNTVVPSVFSNDQIHTPTWLHAEVVALKFSPLAEVVYKVRVRA